MDLTQLTQLEPTAWRIEQRGAMRVPGIIYGDENLIREMDDKVLVQTSNVASLPGIVAAVYVMPDAHWGYGFPIGGVAAFDPENDGVVSAGGVGFDISCGVRTMLTNITLEEILRIQKDLADSLFEQIPAGLGSEGALSLDERAMDAMLLGGARWAVEHGWGDERDLSRVEEQGRVEDARPDCVSGRAKTRQRQEMGTLGSGNHYLEVQFISEIFDSKVAQLFGLKAQQIVVTIHCGSRGLGHQVGSDFVKEMLALASATGLVLPDRELACAPIHSETGERYMGAMRAASNCALANREILGHLARRVMRHFFPTSDMPLLFDVSHNTCKVEKHNVNGKLKDLFVHRKGATRAFGPGHPSLPKDLNEIGQPVLIGGSMGTASYILVGTLEGEKKSFSSACHGAGRAMSRHAAGKVWHGRAVSEDLFKQGIVIRSPSVRGIAEEAPGAYKDVSAVIDAAERAGLARPVARLRPVICIKG